MDTTADAAGLFGAPGSPSSRLLAPDGTSAAIALSAARFDAPATPGGRVARHAVLSRTDTFADSLAGSALTGDGPLLLAGSAELDPAVRAELARVLAPGGRVYLLGGTVALSAEIEDALRTAGHDVVRLAGDSRVETALAVADEVRALHPGHDTALLARAGGDGTSAWADSITVGGWAASSGSPVLLTGGEELHPSVAAWLRLDRPAETVVLGGEDALGSRVLSAAPNPRRVAGADRAGTAVAVVRELWDPPEDGPRRRMLLHGWRDDGWQRGLPAAGLSADTAAPLLLVGDTVPAATFDALAGCGDPQVSTLVLGGTDVLSQAVVDALDHADGRGTC